MTEPTYSVRIDLDPTIAGAEEYFYEPSTGKLFMSVADAATGTLAPMQSHIHTRAKSSYGETQFGIGDANTQRIIDLSVEGGKLKLDFFDSKGEAYMCEDKATFKGYVRLNQDWTNFEHAVTPSEGWHKKGTNGGAEPADAIAVQSRPKA